MAYAEFDYNLTDEQKAMRDMVRKFGVEVIRPAGIELDQMADPADVIAEGSVLWDVLKQSRELGFHKRNFTKAFGGMAEEMDPMMNLLSTEELGYADAGLAISMGASGMPFAYCQASPVPKLQALARELGVAARVRFLGWRDDRDALFAAADICVFPSRFEPYGNVTMEAWGQRRPLVAAASAGPVAYVRDGEDGLLAPVDDAPALAAAIGRVIDEPALAARLVEAGWRRYQDEFTEAASVARYLQLFLRLLAERAGGERVDAT